MNAPKRIWVRELPSEGDGILIGLSYHREPVEAGTQYQYIRADLVGGLVEALNHYAESYCEGWCKENGGLFDDCGGCKARAALAKLEEEQ